MLDNPRRPGAGIEVNLGNSWSLSCILSVTDRIKKTVAFLT